MDREELYENLQDIDAKIKQQIGDSHNEKTYRKILVNNIQQSFMVWLQNYIWTKYQTIP